MIVHTNRQGTEKLKKGVFITCLPVCSLCDGHLDQINHFSLLYNPFGLLHDQSGPGDQEQGGRQRSKRSAIATSPKAHK